MTSKSNVVYNMRQLLKNESHSAQNKAFDSLTMLTMWYFRMQSSGSVRKPGPSDTDHPGCLFIPFVARQPLRDALF